MKFIGYLIAAFMVLYFVGGLFPAEDSAKERNDDSGFCNTGHLLVRRAVFPDLSDKDARNVARRHGECVVQGSGDRRTIRYAYRVVKMDSVIKYRADIVRTGQDYRLCGIYFEWPGGLEAAPENERLQRHAACN